MALEVMIPCSNVVSFPASGSTSTTVTRRRPTGLSLPYWLLALIVIAYFMSRK